MRSAVALVGWAFFALVVLGGMGLLDLQVCVYDFGNCAKECTK